MTVKVKLSKAKEATVSISMDEESADILRNALERQCVDAEQEEIEVLDAIIQGLNGDEP